MLRSSILGIGLAVAALVASIQVTGCGDSGGSGGSTGAAGTTGSAGTTGTAGTTGVAGTTGAGGTTTGAAGSGSGTAGTGSGTAGTTGAAGATGAAGSGAFGQPACLGTVTKGGACAATDQQLCYKTCGPQSKGVKSETCTSGAYVEMTGCSFDPAGDYSCYKLPTTANAMCPAAATPPKAGQPCTVDMCNPCNTSGGLAGGMYQDSSGADKVGWCVCPPANASGNRSWSCASDTAWPCTAAGGAPGCS